LKKIKFHTIIYLLLFLSILLILTDVYNGESGLTTDGFCYIQVSKNFFQGAGYTIAGQKHTVFPPGYPLLIGIFSLVFKNYLLSAQLISILSFILAGLLLFSILRKCIKNNILIIIFMALFLFHKSIINLSNLIVSDSLYVLLMIINLKLMILILKDKKSDIKYFLGIGLINGYMYLTRPEGFIIFVINILIFLFFFWKHKFKIHKLIIMILAFLILCLPYISFLYSASGKLLISGKTMNFSLLEVVEDKSEEYLWEKTGYKLLEDGKNVVITSSANSDFSSLDYLLQNRENIVRRIFINISSYIKALILSFGFLLIFLLNIFFVKKIKKIKPEYYFLLVYLFMITISSGYLLIFRINRYWISYLPVFLILLAILTEVSIEQKHIKKWIVICFALSGILINIFAGRNEFKNVFQVKNQFVIEKIAGKWMKMNFPENEIIIVRKPFAAFFGEKEWLRIPWFNDSNSFVNYMKRNNFKYFILSEHERSKRPFLYKDEKNGKLNNYAEVIKTFNYADNNIKILKIR